MIARTGVDGVTVARGAIGNPWIFKEARALAAGLPLPPPPSLVQQRAVIETHYGLAEEIYGPRWCLGPMRKFGIKYSQLHPQAEQVRDAFVAADGPGEWRQVLQQWYCGAD
jgi:tRNA-dihydrouridine synthase